MLDEKDLQAIASLIDTKLFPIQSQLSDMQGDISGMKGDIVSLKSDVSMLKSDVSMLKSDVGTLKSDVGTLKSDVGTLKSDVGTLKSDVVSLKSEMHKMQGDIEEIKETLSDHTVALNELLAWADDAQVVVKIPFGKVQERFPRQICVRQGSGRRAYFVYGQVRSRSLAQIRSERFKLFYRIIV